jgi:hypothetical protein
MGLSETIILGILGTLGIFFIQAFFFTSENLR